jgi:hypothetical protein
MVALPSDLNSNSNVCHAFITADTLPDSPTAVLALFLK